MHSLKIFALAAGLACAAAAQTAAPQGATQAPKPPAHLSATPTENANEPVITIQNLCPARKAGAECKTVITKAQFEKILDAVRPNLPASARMQIAQKYVELLAIADKAEQEGLDKSPEFQEQLKLLKMQALASAFTRNLQEKYAQLPDAEVEKYYRDNKPAYEELSLKRIYIPKPVASGEKKPPLDEAATKALAEKIQARAAAGEDFDKLQQEVFAAENPDAPKNSAPPTSIGVRRRGQLPQQQESKIFELNAGQVSPVMEEPAGYFIYKVESKDLLPLDKVKAQISRQLEEQKMRDALEQTISSAKPTFNENYFKTPAEEAPGTPGASAGHPDGRTMPPVPPPSPKAK